MKAHPLAKHFPLGKTVITANALDKLNPEDIFQATLRHAVGDGSNLRAADQAKTELSSKAGFRLLSAYADRHGPKFWIITGADRLATVLLPEDY